MRKILLVAIIFIVVVLGLLVKLPKKSTQTKLQKVAIMVPFISQIQWVAYYTAKNKGYYKDEGLDVDIQYSTKGDAGPIEQLIGGKVDLIHVGEGGMIMARSKGLDVVAVYPIEPTNVFYLISEKNKNITKPADLIGKKIGLISSASGAYPNLIVILRLANIDKNNVEIVQAGTTVVPAFLEKKFDVAAVHLSQKLLIEEKMPDLNVINASDYTDISREHIAVTGNFIKSNPELIKKFLKATKKGLEYAVDHPEEAINIYLGFYPDAAPQKKVSQDLWNAFIEAHHYKKNLPGVEKPQGWQKSQDVLFDTGMITKKTEISSMYTNKFAPQ